ncbi:MAG: hypothetical protein RLZZ299_381 [Pseudomonadota bacterium]|jgi:uncharacterized membrane protein YedE/YeeE
MKANLASLLAGLIFAVGLGISGMTQPAKVIGFLDVAGAWDPSLMLVMVGAIGVNAAVYWGVVRRRETPVFAPRFLVPTRTDLDARLILGAVIFGVGWGLGGFCPGPGLVSLAGGGMPAVVFVGSMLAGMGLFAAWDRVKA